MYEVEVVVRRDGEVVRQETYKGDELAGVVDAAVSSLDELEATEEEE